MWRDITHGLVDLACWCRTTTDKPPNLKKNPTRMRMSVFVPWRRYAQRGRVHAPTAEDKSLRPACRGKLEQYQDWRIYRRALQEAQNTNQNDTFLTSIRLCTNYFSDTLVNDILIKRKLFLRNYIVRLIVDKNRKIVTIFLKHAIIICFIDAAEKPRTNTTRKALLQLRTRSENEKHCRKPFQTREFSQDKYCKLIHFVCLHSDKHFRKRTNLCETAIFRFLGDRKQLSVCHMTVQQQLALTCVKNAAITTRHCTKIIQFHLQHRKQLFRRLFSENRFLLWC